jgi:hypothetical protein
LCLPSSEITKSDQLNLFKPPSAQTAPQPQAFVCLSVRGRKAKPRWREMTPMERRAIELIRFPRVSYPPGTGWKRFARNLNKQLAAGAQITDAQAQRLWEHVWRFRRQIDDWELTDLAGKIALPGYKC